MTDSNISQGPAVLASTFALLSLLSRTFIDYHVVYAEVGLSSGGLGGITLFNLALFGGWIWALVQASHGVRLGAIVLFGYSVVLVIFGALTVASLCPPPCRTMWPVGSIAVWSNLVIGIPTVVLTWRGIPAKLGPPRGP